MAMSNSNLRQTSTSSNENQENIVKDIEKVGFLSLKLAKDNEASSLNYQRFWAMFYVINNRLINDEQPVLELFQKEQKLQHVNSQESVAKINLKTTLHISIPILFNEKENENEFCLSLENQLLQIYVDNKEQLNEWVNCLRTKLASLNVFSPKDNLYSKEPMSSIKKAINRPLPPIPTEGSVNGAQSEPSARNNAQHHPLSRPIERLIDRLQGRTVDRGRGDSNEQNRLLGLNSSAATVSPSYQPTHSTDHLINQRFQLHHPTSNINNYEHLAISNQINHPTNGRTENSQFNADNQFNTLSSYRSSNQSSIQSNEINSQVMSLRESQVLQLQREIRNRGGVKLRIRKIDCLDSLALVEWLGHIWVGGWKQRYHPQLHSTFKIGDEIVFVNGYRATSEKDVHCIIRQSEEPIIEFIIKRTPYGRVFLLKREYPGQELGKESCFSTCNSVNENSDFY